MRVFSVILLAFHYVVHQFGDAKAVSIHYEGYCSGLERVDDRSKFSPEHRWRRGLERRSAISRGACAFVLPDADFGFGAGALALGVGGKANLTFFFGAGASAPSLSLSTLALVVALMTPARALAPALAASSAA